MTPSNSAELFVVSGISLGLTSHVYHELQTLLPERFPDRTFKFVGNPFKGWQHPLLWGETERDLHSCSRLLKCWTPLCELVCKEVSPALDRGDIVVTQRLGFDAVLYAISRMPSDAIDEEHERSIRRENDQAEGLHHHGIVHGVVKQNLKSLPWYFIPCARPEAITRDWIKRSHLLQEVEPEKLSAFVEYEQAAMNRYFHPNNGQNPPTYLDASLSVADMCETAMARMAELLQPKQLQFA